MAVEFEVKAPVPPALEAPLRQKLGAPEAAEDHVDTYFAHPDPARDFRRTDEAVRLSVRGERVELTYKGPKLDGRTKARREIVVAVPSEGTARAFLEAVGFRAAAEVRKHRERFHVEGFEVALDSVPGLGVFVELERQADDDEDRAHMEAEAEALLRRWGLVERERRSYLELLAARLSAGSSAAP